MESVLQSDDPGAAVASIAPLLMEAFAADAVVIAEDNRLRIVGELSEELAARVIGWLDDDRAPGYDVFSCDSASEHPAQLGQFDGWCGILALRYDELSSGWIVLLRKEQLETVNWGDTPRHVFPSGPHGVRLTPQGSTAVWQETVRGTSSPWTLSQMALSRSMSNELARVGASRVAELTRARTYLLGMLGHDLRDPLQAIAMATRVLEKDDKVASGAGARFVKSISRSAGRMARLIAQILDASRLQTRADLTMFKERIDVSRLLLDLIDEAQVAYPTITILHDAMPPVFAFIDGDRMSQLIGNLLSNARQYGTRGEPIIVHLAKQADEVLIEVSNAAPPIDAELLPHLFSAFRRAASSNSRNKTGLGLGLHIAQAVAKGHNGHIEYRYISDCVMFSLRFPTADRRTDRGTTPIAAT